MKEDRLQLKAPAKINWTLEVLSRRADGYHEIRTVLQAIDLCDTVTLELSEQLSLAVTGLPIDEGKLPVEDNLAYRAAELLQRSTGCALGARIVVEKVIPAGAGLGGGSSDAAAVLLGLNRLWRLDLDVGALAAISSQLGSDVPFFLIGGAALGEGRGDIVQPLPPPAGQWLVLALPSASLSEPGKTARLYSLLTPDLYTDGSITRALVERLQRGESVTDADVYNVFERVATRAFPAMSDWQETLRTAGARQAHLAGSGPTLFALAADRQEAARICRRIEERGLPALAVATLGRPATDDGP